MKNTMVSLSLVGLVGLASQANADADVSSTVSSTVSPAGKSIGVGLELGAPTTINAKFMIAPNQGVVVGVGGGAWYDASLSLHADYLFHPLVLQFDDGSFSGYVGGGLWTSLGLGGAGYRGPHYGYYQPYGPGPETVSAGARLPLGLTVAFNQVPVELFLEIVPALSLFPGFGAFGQGGVGARFYF